MIARAVLFPCALLAACHVGPVHEAPELALPATFAEARGPAGALAADERWWQRFGDPTLDGLVERAVGGNPDLALARARVREARALRDAALGTRRPTLDAFAGYSRAGPSENGRAPAVGDHDLYEVGFDARWEADLFGRLDAGVLAAEAGVQASEESSRDALVSLLGEVAREYTTLRGTQRGLAILRENLATQRDTLGLTRAREQAGLAPELDSARAVAQVEGTAALVPALEAAAHASIHRLSVLVGGVPGALLEELSIEAAIPLAPDDVATGVPADVVRRRPDVRRAERELARETALTAQATAELYPRLVISASVGQESQRLSDLFDGGSTAWSLGGALLAPIFEGDRLRANVRAQEARREQAALAWKATVLEALREVEDALSNVARDRERAARLGAAVEASRRAVQLALDLNAQGLADFFEVLEAQRALLASESQLVESQASVTGQTVALYKALGGAPAEGAFAVDAPAGVAGAGLMSGW